MFIESLCNLVYTVITALLNWVNIPDFPENMINAFASGLEIVYNGMSLLVYFLPRNVWQYGIKILLAIIAFEYLYYIIMWILKKIPVLGIE